MEKTTSKLPGTPVQSPASLQSYPQLPCHAGLSFTVRLSVLLVLVRAVPVDVCYGYPPPRDDTPSLSSGATPCRSRNPKPA